MICGQTSLGIVLFSAILGLTGCATVPTNPSGQSGGMEQKPAYVPGAEDEKEIKGLVEQFIERCWKQHDVDSVLEFMSPNATFSLWSRHFHVDRSGYMKFRQEIKDNPEKASITGYELSRPEFIKQGTKASLKVHYTLVSSGRGKLERTRYFILERTFNSWKILKLSDKEIISSDS